MALLGRRAPLSLKLFVTAFAIADDIGAVVVIALAYTGSISWIHVGVGAALLAVLVTANWASIGHALVYAIIGVGVWLAFLTSGIHASIAGVLVAVTVPSRVVIRPDQFLARGRALLDTFERSGNPLEEEHTTIAQRAAIHELEITCHDVQSPLQQIEHELQPWVTYLVVPLFALANAGVALDFNIGGMLDNQVTLGIVAGLLLGKQVGITLFAWIAVRTGLATMPSDLTWRHIYGAALLGGIGFTMSLFITGLAFSDVGLISQAKVGILVGSIASGAVGWLVLRGIDGSRVRGRMRQFLTPVNKLIQPGG